MKNEKIETATRILIAEDDEAMRIFLENALSRAGHLVNALPNGESAASCSELGGYDILVTDVKMPGMDGVDLARLMLAEIAGSAGYVRNRFCDVRIAGN